MEYDVACKVKDQVAEVFGINAIIEEQKVGGMFLRFALGRRIVSDDTISQVERLAKLYGLTFCIGADFTDDGRITQVVYLELDAGASNVDEDLGENPVVASTPVDNIGIPGNLIVETFENGDTYVVEPVSQRRVVLVVAASHPTAAHKEAVGLMEIPHFCRAMHNQITEV